MYHFGNLKAKRGVIHVLKDRCKGCGFCVEFCPKDVLKLSEEFNVKGYHPPSVIQEDDCCFCRLCEAICPDYSIFVTLNEEDKEKDVEDE